MAAPSVDLLYRRERAGHYSAEVLGLLEETPRDRVVDEHRRAYEQHHHVRPETIGRGTAVARTVDHRRHSLGRTSGLGHHDGGLRGDRLAASPGLSPVEQLIHDQDCDQQH